MIQRIEILMGLLLLTLTFGVVVWSVSRSLVAGLMCVVALVSCILTAFSAEPTTTFLGLKLTLVAARSFGLILALVFFIVSVPKSYFPHLLTFFEVLALVNAVLMLIFGFGFFNADSMDAAFIATIYPMILFRGKEQWPIWAKTLVYTLPLMILLTPRVGRTAFVVAGISLGSYMILKKRSTVYALITVCVVSVVAGLKGLPFDLAERSEAWAFFMAWWSQNANPLIGMGGGSFQWLGPELQTEIAKSQIAKNIDPSQIVKLGNLYKFLHNDWLQIMFEQGVLGFTLAVSLAVSCLKRTARVHWLFATNIGFCISMIPQFPLRYFVGQLLAVVLIRASLEGE